jgi:hypothetical protein
MSAAAMASASVQPLATVFSASALMRPFTRESSTAWLTISVSTKGLSILADRRRVAERRPKDPTDYGSRARRPPIGICSDLQTSVPGIANIGGSCARSLQLPQRH